MPDGPQLQSKNKDISESDCSTSQFVTPPPLEQVCRDNPSVTTTTHTHARTPPCRHGMAMVRFRALSDIGTSSWTLVAPGNRDINGPRLLRHPLTTFLPDISPRTPDWPFADWAREQGRIFVFTGVYTRSVTASHGIQSPRRRDRGPSAVQGSTVHPRKSFAFFLPLTSCRLGSSGFSKKLDRDNLWRWRHCHTGMGVGFSL